MKKVLLKLIRIYQQTLSPDHGWFVGASAMRCRYYPSCSQYGYESIENLGVIKGSLNTMFRILRCNPLFPGGIDHPTP